MSATKKKVSVRCDKCVRQLTACECGDRLVGFDRAARSAAARQDARLLAELEASIEGDPEGGCR